MALPTATAVPAFEEGKQPSVFPLQEEKDAEVEEFATLSPLPHDQVRKRTSLLKTISWESKSYNVRIENRAMEEPEASVILFFLEDSVSGKKFSAVLSNKEQECLRLHEGAPLALCTVKNLFTFMEEAFEQKKPEFEISLPEFLQVSDTTVDLLVSYTPGWSTFQVEVGLSIYHNPSVEEVRQMALDKKLGALEGRVNVEAEALRKEVSKLTEENASLKKLMHQFHQSRIVMVGSRAIPKNTKELEIAFSAHETSGSVERNGCPLVEGFSECRLPCENVLAVNSSSYSSFPAAYPQHQLPVLLPQRSLNDLLQLDQIEALSLILHSSQAVILRSSQTDADVIKQFDLSVIEGMKNLKCLRIAVVGRIVKCILPDLSSLENLESFAVFEEGRLYYEIDERYAHVSLKQQRMETCKLVVDRDIFSVLASCKNLRLVTLECSVLQTYANQPCEITHLLSATRKLELKWQSIYHSICSNFLYNRSADAQRGGSLVVSYIQARVPSFVKNTPMPLGPNVTLTYIE